MIKENKGKFLNLIKHGIKLDSKISQPLQAFSLEPLESILIPMFNCSEEFPNIAKQANSIVGRIFGKWINHLQKRKTGETSCQHQFAILLLETTLYICI